MRITRKKQKWIRRLAAALLVAGGVAYLSASEDPATSPGEPSYKRVRVAAVEAASVRRELRLTGTLRASRRARLSFPYGGRLIDRPVEIGDRVTEGQVLGRIDDLELRHAVNSAEAALAELTARRLQAARDHDRARRLEQAKAATEEEVERTAAAVDALKAGEEAATTRLLEARRRLAETALRAPFDGTVTETLVEPGELVPAGRPVVILSGDGELEVEVEVPGSVIARLRSGDGIGVAMPDLAEPGSPAPVVGARITSVGRTAIGAGRLFPVVAVVSSEVVSPEVVSPADLDGRLAAGMTAEARLELRSDGGLAVPVEAVVNPGGRRPVVFRVTEDGDGALRVSKVAVVVGSLLGRLVVVRGELAIGDRVVVGGQRGLLDGQQVEVERWTS